MKTRFTLLLSLFTVVTAVLISTAYAKPTLSSLERENSLQSGFVGIVDDQQSGKLYLRIDNLDQQFIYQTSLPSGLGSNDIGLDRGQLGETRLVKFEQHGNKLFLKQLPTAFRAVTDNELEAAAIDEAFAASVLWGFEVVDQGSGWVLVDASDFVLQDIHGVGRTLAARGQGKGYQVDASRSALDAEHSKAFPDNTELQATITLVGQEPGEYLTEAAPNPYAVTLKMRHSFIRLPEPGYQARAYLPKSGYWSIQYQDYAQAINKPITQRYIGRHRLHKKDPAAARSEAVAPIVYYIDPGVPEPVRSALIDGAKWWAEAFEALGYVDGYQVKILPEDADPMDLRYNVIQWVHRSTRGWSYGSSVIDPRNGEIIKGHVTLGSLRVRQDYLIAQGMMAPFADSEDDQTLMDLALARIRQLSAHEVGHTLGLLHNFAASNYGRESVMDYPHPQFELDGEQIVAPNAYGVGLGKWDKAAIAYGYQEFIDEQGQAIDEPAVLAQLNARLRQTDADGLKYINDQDARGAGSPHANASLWDNGADAVTELKRMYALRQVALANFGAANLKAGQPWSELEEILLPVFYSHRYQTEAAAKWVGGMTYEYDRKDRELQASNGPSVQVLGGNDQTRAMMVLLESLQAEFLVLPDSALAMMVPKAAEYARSRESLHGNTGIAFDQVALATKSAQHTLSLILHPQRLARLHQQSAADPTIPSIAQLTNALHAQVIATEKSGINAAIHQAVIDLIYSNYLNILQTSTVAPEVRVAMFEALNTERNYLERRLPKASTEYRASIRYQLKRLESLSVSPSDKLIELPSLPPGSPI
ncbi:zinc-dependent metalloprotease [Arenicella xantha]|nr:zinc-dependent metalloprotease [Arenicella xantha]